jgi:hypothetical protein
MLLASEYVSRHYKRSEVTYRAGERVGFLSTFCLSRDGTVRYSFIRSQ